MVYTAAQSGGQQFIEIVFGTSAGQLVFNSYKDKKPLPEDFARANGHEELAEYFKDIKTRFVKCPCKAAFGVLRNWLSFSQMLTSF